MTLNQIYARINEIDEQLKTETNEDYRYELQIAKGELEAAAMDMESQQQMETDMYYEDEPNTR